MIENSHISRNLRTQSRKIFNIVSLTRQEAEIEKAKEEVKTWNLDLG
jgi:hypothetical protein